MMDYFRDRWQLLGLGLSFIALASLLFWLYAIPLEVIGYLLVLYAFFLLLLVPYDYYRYRTRKRQLKMIQKHFMMMEDLVLPQRRVYERDYAAIIERMAVAMASQKAAYHRREQSRQQYHTLWVHQIKLPIAALKLQLETEEEPDVGKLKAELMRIDRYVNMSLAYARLNSSTSDYLFRSYALDDLIKKALRHFSYEFMMRQLTLQFEPTGMQIITDEKWLTFVLEQLISNALKYTKQGHIHIYAPEAMCLVIEDTGQGIEASDLPRLFELGYTGLNGHSQNRSSGIGLYLCKEILQRLSCKIEIKSEVGVGTRVFLYFDQRPLQVE